jgi:hypothetical protein
MPKAMAKICIENGRKNLIHAEISELARVLQIYLCNLLKRLLPFRHDVPCCELFTSRMLRLVRRPFSLEGASMQALYPAVPSFQLVRET